MIYCLMMHLRTDNPGLQTAALAVAPNILDNRVYAPRLGEYKVELEGAEDGGMCVNVEVRFNTEADAIDFYNNAKGLAGIFTACRQGAPGSSYIHIHECFADETPGSPCHLLPGYLMESP